MKIRESLISMLCSPTLSTKLRSWDRRTAPPKLSLGVAGMRCSFLHCLHAASLSQAHLRTAIGCTEIEAERKTAAWMSHITRERAWILHKAMDLKNLSYLCPYTNFSQAVELFPSQVSRSLRRHFPPLCSQLSGEMITGPPMFQREGWLFQLPPPPPRYSAGPLNVFTI